ncbi:epoxide hydrolase family protein [Microbacterium chocolatum]|uniref:epoxide hydrolase family protein n=1 Tax=Microbacterium aurantiacum TaxID=162393 RepID=UPI00338D52F6
MTTPPMDHRVLRITDSEMDTLRERLRAAALPTPSPGPEWSRGIPLRVLERLRTHWVERHDGRALERRINAETHTFHATDIGTLHAMHCAGDETALPVLAIHGWPYSYAQFVPLADAIDGRRTLVAPSLPGFGHSPAASEPFSARRIAEALHRVMTDDAGHARYLVYGEDIGAPVADWIAGLYPHAVAGIIASHPSYSAQAREGVELTDAERAYLTTARDPAESGYAHQQGTRPDTLAVALQDSPVGLLAWIAEKVAAWSDGGVATEFSRLSDDDVIDLVALYWHTRSIGTSFRSYSEPDDFDDHPIVTAPASILINTHERGYPRSLAEKSYTDIRSFERLESGGHFTAWENPHAVAAAIEEHARRVSSPS